MSHRLLGAALALVAVAATVGPAAAVPGRIAQGVLLALPSARHLTDGSVTAPPRAFEAFCAGDAARCSGDGVTAPLHLDGEHWADLDRVNRRVNRHIRPQADAPGTDVWTLGADAGDCDDYAVEKRRELIDLGWPVAPLALTVAFLSSGEPHLVLTVRTDRGDFVLDNLRNRVVAVEHTGYRWIARQSTIHPRLWVRVDGFSTEAPLVAAAESRPVVPEPAVAIGDPIVETTATVEPAGSRPAVEPISLGLREISAPADH
jgi:predicted transglutaminase-like cysteine proteinase